jgi:hypothetical protein
MALISVWTAVTGWLLINAENAGNGEEGTVAATNHKSLVTNHLSLSCFPEFPPSITNG